MTNVPSIPQTLERAPRSATTFAHYVIDPAHATASFRVRHLMVANVRGELGEIRGTVLLAEEDLSRSEVHAVIDATSIDTRNPQRDAHLRSPDFLDVANFPQITFRSTRVVVKPEGELQVFGKLTLRGVTREVLLDVALSEEIRSPDGDRKRGVTATSRINRKDFGVSWNSRMDDGGVVVGDIVGIALELELIRREPAA